MAADRDNANKLRLDLLPVAALCDVAAVMTYGATKYAERNWEQGAKPSGEYIACALRHILAYQGGEDIDPESRRPHLAHAATNLLFLLELTACQKVADNRSDIAAAPATRQRVRGACDSDSPARQERVELS